MGTEAPITVSGNNRPPRRQLAKQKGKMLARGEKSGVGSCLGACLPKRESMQKVYLQPFVIGKRVCLKSLCQDEEWMVIVEVFSHTNSAGLVQRKTTVAQKKKKNSSNV